MTCAYSTATLRLVAALALVPLACSGDDSGETTGATATSSTSSTTSNDTSTSSTTDDSTTTTTGETTASGSETAGETTTTTTTGETTSEETTTTTTTTGDVDPVIIDGFDHPESALYAGQEMYWYISNIGGDPSAKDGDGFISRLNADGSVDAMQWATGFNGPKGLGLAGGRLYVADIDTLHVVNVADATISTSYVIDGAGFLNDVAVDMEGSVYVSDTATNTIHVLKAGEQPAVYLQSDDLHGPNGLTFTDGRLFVVSVGDMMGDGGVFEIIDGAPVQLGALTGGLDGVNARMNDLLITDFAGQLYRVPLMTGESNLLMDFADDYSFMSSADFGLARPLGLIAVPDLLGNKVGIFPL